MAATEVELMQRYCDGDAAAFRELYALVAPRLFNYLLRMAGDRALADDLLQATFLKVHRARAAYVRGASPVPWMYSIAHRTFIDETRRRKRAKVRLSDNQDGTVPEVSAHISGKASDQVEEPRHDPELTRQVLEAMESLPDSQREALVLTKLNGKSIAEAAEIAGTTPGAMKLRAHRAYVALRKKVGAMAKKGDDESWSRKTA